MSWTKEEIIEGIRCEKCYPRNFGEMVDDSSENLYIYKDMGGNTRCFCVKHMTFLTEEGAMTNFEKEGAKVGYGDELKSEILGYGKEDAKRRKSE